MGAFAAPLMIASTVLGGISSYKQAQAEKANAKYQAAVSTNNAIYQNQAAERNLALAEDAKKRGETDAYRKSIEIRQLAGKQKSALASGGVDVAYGSSLDLIGDTFALGQLDLNTIRGNAAREANQYENAAWQNRIGASNDIAQASVYRAQAKNTSPFLSAGMTLLSGASSLAGNWNKMYPSNTETIKWNQGGTSTIKR